MADAHASGACGIIPVEVRLLSRPLKITNKGKGEAGGISIFLELGTLTYDTDRKKNSGKSQRSNHCA